MSHPHYTRPDTAGIARRDCAICGFPNAHLRTKSGWQCLACRNTIVFEERPPEPPARPTFHDRTLPPPAEPKAKPCYSPLVIII